MAMVFSKKVKLSSREEMISFLKNHFRYDTMSSWNRSTSYANNMKIHHLGLPNMAYDLLGMQEVTDDIDDLISEWREEEQNNYWTAGFNGRSGGYLVLYQCRLEPSGYKSFCTSCGQRNYQSIEKSNKCGRCGAESRIDYAKPHMTLKTYPGRNIDDEDFADWDMFALKDRVRLVQSFDRLCDDIVLLVADLCNSYKVVEKEICVPRKIKVLQAV